MSYVIEPAKSSRSKCRKCNKLIAEGEMRVGTPHHEYDSYLWYHKFCAAEKGIIKMKTKHFSDDVWVKASLRAADEHHQETNCSCNTYLLVSRGCQCGAKKKKLQKQQSLGLDINYATLEKQIVASTHRAKTLNDAAFQMMYGGPVKKKSATILDKAVVKASKPIAKRIAPLKAEVEIAQQAFIPGMRVYHVFTHHSYILTSPGQEGYWNLASEDGSMAHFQTALLTTTKPGFWASAVALYEQNAKVRLVLWMSILLTLLFGSLSGILLTALLTR
jgi:Poly(ADP-ribose) polymerase and DNA-Ligase Zn-finger region